MPVRLYRRTAIRKHTYTLRLKSRKHIIEEEKA